MSLGTLCVIPSVPVWVEDDQLIFDRKFYDGLMLYKQLWDGALLCILEASSTNKPHFGLVYKDKKELDFQCTVISSFEKITIEHLSKAKIVLASADSATQLHIPKICKDNGIKCVCIIEYISDTRRQIVSLDAPNSLIKMRRYLYLWQMERKRLKAFEAVDGLQFNGIPASEEYNNFGKNNITYFDTRTFLNDMVHFSELNKKLDNAKKSKRFNLAFSGRLISIKGADHLIEMAKLLNDKNVDFQLLIYGEGELKKSMIDKVNKYKLTNRVFIFGAVDFQNELLPALKENVDIFVCLHRQSDPSCTYMETLACGVPIVGYNNKAFSGILNQADVGWQVDMDDLSSLVNTIKRLFLHRDEIIEKSINSLNYAIGNDFETTFVKRVEHLASFLRP